MEQKIEKLLSNRELIRNGSLSFEEFVLFLENVNAILRNKNLGDKETGIYKESMLASDLVSPTNEVQMEILKQYYDSLNKIESLKAKAALSYYILNDLHLFRDGNGRTSRFMYQLFEGDFDIDYVLHDESDLSIKRGIERDKNIESIDTVNYYSSFILLKKLIYNGTIENNSRLQKYNTIQTFGKSGFILDHSNQTDLPESVRDFLGKEGIERFERNMTNNNGFITVSGIAMCIMLSKLGILDKALDKNEEKIIEMKKNPISGFDYDKRLSFRVGSSQHVKSDIDFSSWTVDMCNEFSDISENVHKKQLEILIDIFVNPERYMFNQNESYLSKIINEKVQESMKNSQL